MTSTMAGSPPRMERLTWLRAWAAERFPARNAVFFAALYLAGAFVAQASTHDGAIRLGLRDLAGFGALWAFFLLLRVFDEHKDFEADAVAHPERVLQRGLVSLDQLEVLGVLAAATTFLVSLWMDAGIGPVTTWWLATISWSGLMAREFFVRAWLRRHTMLYAVTHLLVMPLATGWVVSMAGASPLESPTTRMLLVLAFISGLAFEMARKMRAPRDERDGADSYTRALGVRAAADVLLLVTAAAMAVALLVTRLTSGATPLIVGIAATLVAALPLVHFRRRHTTRAAKLVEAGVGVSMLIAYVSLLTVIAGSRGLEVQ